MANENQSPRVTVREKRAGTPQIRGVPTSVGGMLQSALRGPANKAVRVSSFPQWSRIFGGYDINSFAAESVDAFFKNGGSAMYFTRILPSSGGSNVKAATTLTTSGGATSGSLSSNAAVFPLGTLASADTFVGAVDGGGALTLTITATKAFKVGAAATYALGAGGDSVTIAITGANGGANQVIDLSAAAATQAGYLAKINEQLVGGRAIDSGGQIRIETDVAGTAAAGSIVALAGAAAAKTGLAAGAFTAGTGNVANLGAVTAAEFAALLTATFTGSTGTANGDGSVTWKSNTTGVSSSVKFNSGAGIAKVAGFDTIIHSGLASGTQNALTVTAAGEGVDSNGLSVLITTQDNRLSSTIPALQASGVITQLTVNTSVAARLQAGDTIKMTDATTSTTARGIIKQVRGSVLVFTANVTLSGNLTAANTVITLETFSFSVFYNGALIHGPLSALRMSPLSQRSYFARILNVDNDEYPVKVTDLSPALTANADIRPISVNTSVGDSLSGGADATTFVDADYIGVQASGTGLYSMDKKSDLRMLCIPGVQGIGVTGAISKALLEYCTNRADCIAILTAAQNTTPTNAVSYKSANLGSSSYYAMYYPWVQIVGPLTGVKQASPPEGYVMGVMARTDRTEGLQQAPAGEDIGRLVGTVGVELVVSDDDKNLLYPANINPIEDLPDVGQCIMGSRTGEIGTEFEQIHIRRTFIFLRLSLQKGTRFALFLSNVPESWSKVQRSGEAFLRAQWNNGLLEGETESEAFTFVCDETTNPAQQVAQKLMSAESIVNIPQTTENLNITIQQDQRGIAALGT